MIESNDVLWEFISSTLTSFPSGNEMLGLKFFLYSTNCCIVYFSSMSNHEFCTIMLALQYCAALHRHQSHVEAALWTTVAESLGQLDSISSDSAFIYFILSWAEWSIVPEKWQNLKQCLITAISNYDKPTLETWRMKYKAYTLFTVKRELQSIYLFSFVWSSAVLVVTCQSFWRYHKYGIEKERSPTSIKTDVS